MAVKHDVALPPRQAAAFEVIEPDLVFEFLVLLLDRPPLMRQADQRAQRGGGRADPPSSSGRGRRPPVPVRRATRLRARAVGSRQSCAGVTRTAQKRARHGRFVPLRHETSRHWRGVWVAAQARASTVCVSGGNTPAGARTSFAGQRRRRLEGGRPQEHLEIGRDAQRVGQLGPMQRCGAAWRCRRTRHRRRRR